MAVKFIVQHINTAKWRRQPGTEVTQSALRENEAKLLKMPIGIIENAPFFNAHTFFQLN